MTVPETSFRLRSLKDPAEITRNHSLNFKEWGTGLTLKQYLQREVHLGSQTSCADGNLGFWSFEQHNPDTNEWQVASCLETLTRHSFYKVKGQPVKATVSHSIGAVFTPAEFRGKGLAKQLVDAVVREFDNPDAFPQYREIGQDGMQHSFSALWSDVGLYYERMGYKLTSSNDIEYKVDNATPVDKAAYDKVTFITEDMIPSLCKEDEAQLKSKMERDTEADGKTRVAIAPTEHVHELTHARAHYLAPILRPDESKRNEATGGLHRFGAKLQGVWILWTHDLANNKMNILRVHHDESLDEAAFGRAMDQLLKAAEAEAQLWSLQKIALWEQDLPRLSDGTTISLDAVKSHLTNPNVKVGTRDSSLPMWRFWKGLDTDPTTGSKVEWVMDGKYAWF